MFRADSSFCLGIFNKIMKYLEFMIFLKAEGKITTTKFQTQKVQPHKSRGFKNFIQLLKFFAFKLFALCSLYSNKDQNPIRIGAGGFR